MTTLTPSGDKDPKAIVQELKEHYPQGLPGGREQLVTELMNRGGLEHKKALAVANQLGEAGYAHHLPGDSSRWLFTSESVSMRELMAQLDENYDGHVPESDEPRTAILEFIGARLGIDAGVAEEVLTGLEQAGYASVAYHEESLRDRYRVRFPEAFRTIA